MRLKERSGCRKRYLSLCSLCLGAICIGLTLGWPESSLSYFLLTHCDEICYDLSTDGSGTVKMIMNFGSCLGALLPSCIADKYGRKTAFTVAGFFNLIFWIILVSFEGYMEVIFGAVMGGFAAGIFVTTSALYVSEISLPKSRGRTGALTAFCAYVGVLFGTLMIFITYNRIIALIMVSLAMIFLISIRLWMVESPYYLFIQGKTLETKLSLKSLRGASTVLEIDSEYKSIELYLNERRNSSIDDEFNLCEILTCSHRGKYAILVIIFLCITQMVGAYGMGDFSKNFLNTIIPKYGTIVIALLDVCSIVICLYTIEKFGRKPLLITISIVGSSISCLILAVWSFTEKSTTNVHYFGVAITYVPVTIIILYYTIYSLGLIPIVPILTAEIFPSRDKTIALGFYISFIYFSSMIIQSIFELLNAKQDTNLAFGLFFIVGALGIPVVFIFIPETKGKSLYEIQNEFEDIAIVM